MGQASASPSSSPASGTATTARTSPASPGPPAALSPPRSPQPAPFLMLSPRLSLCVHRLSLCVRRLSLCVHRLSVCIHSLSLCVHSLQRNQRDGLYVEKENVPLPFQRLSPPQVLPPRRAVGVAGQPEQLRPGLAGAAAFQHLSSQKGSSVSRKGGLSWSKTVPFFSLPHALKRRCVAKSINSLTAGQAFLCQIQRLLSDAVHGPRGHPRHQRAPCRECQQRPSSPRCF